MLDREKCLLFSRYPQFKDRVADRQAGVRLVNRWFIFVSQLKDLYCVARISSVLI